MITKALKILKPFIRNKKAIYLSSVLALLGMAFVFSPKQSSSDVNNPKQYPTLPQKDSEKTFHRNTSDLKIPTIIQPEAIIEPEGKTKIEPYLPNPRTIHYSPETISINKKIEQENELPVQINLYKAPSLESSTEKLLSNVIPEQASHIIDQAFLGRMLKCELVNTVDSSNLGTPIIGLISESLYSNGRLIIPAGSEIYGKAAKEHLRDRIITDDAWQIKIPISDVYPHGSILKIKGIALDHDNKDGAGQTFGITDGSAGIKGIRIQTTELTELKIFATSFLGAVTAGLQKREPSGGLLGGSIIKSTARDASLGGITSVMEKQVEFLQSQIEENGFYTRVAAGKQFYLFFEELQNPIEWIESIEELI